MADAAGTTLLADPLPDAALRDCAAVWGAGTGVAGGACASTVGTLPSRKSISPAASSIPVAPLLDDMSFVTGTIPRLRHMVLERTNPFNADSNGVAVRQREVIPRNNAGPGH